MNIELLITIAIHLEILLRDESIPFGPGSGIGRCSC